MRARPTAILVAALSIALPLGSGGCDEVDQFANPVFIVSLKANYKTDPPRGRPKTSRLSRRNVAGGVNFGVEGKTGGFTAYDFDAPEFNGTYDDGAENSVAISAQGANGNDLAFWTEIQLENMAGGGITRSRDRGRRVSLDFVVNSATLSGAVTCEGQDQSALDVGAEVEFEGTVVETESMDAPTPISGKIRIRGVGDATFNSRVPIKSR